MSGQSAANSEPTAEQLRAELSTRGLTRTQLLLCSGLTPEWTNNNQQANLCAAAVDNMISQRTFVDYPQALEALRGKRPKLSDPLAPTLQLTEDLLNEARLQGKGVTGTLTVYPSNGTTPIDKPFTKHELYAALGAYPYTADMVPARAYKETPATGAVLGALSAGRTPQKYVGTSADGTSLSVAETAELILAKYPKVRIEKDFHECLKNSGVNDLQTCSNIGIRRSMVKAAGF